MHYFTVARRWCHQWGDELLPFWVPSLIPVFKCPVSLPRRKRDDMYCQSSYWLRPQVPRKINTRMYTTQQMLWVLSPPPLQPSGQKIKPLNAKPPCKKQNWQRPTRWQCMTKRRHILIALWMRATFSTSTNSNWRRKPRGSDLKGCVTILCSFTVAERFP